uniref:APG6 domain-containing protein n=1 Tax=Heligmosomoides polygyrus TaxID=6339 RepID=A0A183GAF3_HELPZ
LLSDVVGNIEENNILQMCFSDFHHPANEIEVAAAFGHIVHFLDCLSLLLDYIFRYPVLSGASTSCIHSPKDSTHRNEKERLGLTGLTAGSRSTQSVVTRSYNNVLQKLVNSTASQLFFSVNSETDVHWVLMCICVFLFHLSTEFSLPLHGTRWRAGRVRLDQALALLGENLSQLRDDTGFRSLTRSDNLLLSVHDWMKGVLQRFVMLFGYKNREGVHPSSF